MQVPYFAKGTTAWISKSNLSDCPWGYQKYNADILLRPDRWASYRMGKASLVLVLPFLPS